MATAHVAIAAAPVRTSEALPVDGPPFAASLVGVDAGWQLEFTAGDNPRKLPAADLVRWGTFVEATRGQRILLSDGGLLVGSVVALDKDQLTCEGDVLGQRKLPLEAVAGLLGAPRSIDSNATA